MVKWIRHRVRGHEAGQRKDRTVLGDGSFSTKWGLWWAFLSIACVGEGEDPS